MYVEGNVINLTDPSGHDPWWCYDTGYFPTEEEKRQCITDYFESKSLTLPVPRPKVIIVCGRDVICAPGNRASLDLFEAWGTVERIPTPPGMTPGTKWGMASQIISKVDVNYPGDIFLVGHSAGGDAVTAFLSVMTPEQADKLRGVVIIDPTLTASIHKSIEDPGYCPGEADYPNVGDMAHILLNSALGRGRLTIYDSNQDYAWDKDSDGKPDPVLLKDFGFVSGAPNYSFLYEEGVDHLKMADTGDKGKKVYRFAVDSLHLAH
jgi:pimeloyl-ACP methyl ester carboxylesterase